MDEVEDIWENLEFADFVSENWSIKVRFLELERLVGKRSLSYKNMVNKIMKKQNITFSNYRVGDFLIRIKNLAMARKTELTIPSTKLIHALAICLKEEGFLSEVKVEEGIMSVKLAQAHKKPVLVDLRLVSKPGLRIYKTVDDIKIRKARASMLILSTPKGIVSGKKAIKENVGGEVIVEVWG